MALDIESIRKKLNTLDFTRRDALALIREVERLRAAIRAMYTAPDAAAFFAAERALREAVQGESPPSLPLLIRAIESRGWLWECGHYQAARGTFYARVWTPGPPADERYGYGETPEEATRQAIEMLPPDPYKK